MLADELTRSHPGAAASLREGIAETLTVTRLAIRGSLKRTLKSTNPIESMIECVRRTSRNVKHWQSGDMALRSPGPYTGLGRASDRPAVSAVSFSGRALSASALSPSSSAVASACSSSRSALSLSRDRPRVNSMWA
ncbi:MAG: putative transposase [Solirubrobacteraceae bacterium]|nr:putative transposase [Solirubrobacteraceae bacterium]